MKIHVLCQENKNIEKYITESRLRDEITRSGS